MLSVLAFDTVRLCRRSETHRREPISWRLKPKCHSNLVALPPGGLVAPLENGVNKGKRKVVNSCPLRNAHAVLDKKTSNLS